MQQSWTRIAAVCAGIGLLGGCATSKEDLMPHGNASMLDIWQQETGGGPAPNHQSRQLLDARLSLRRSLATEGAPGTSNGDASYTRTAQNEIYRQFHRLPNPDLVMYVFPHLAGTDPVPVPGYSTVFPLYQRVQYALPGERAVDY